MMSSSVRLGVEYGQFDLIEAVNDLIDAEGVIEYAISLVENGSTTKALEALKDYVNEHR